MLIFEKSYEQSEHYKYDKIYDCKQQNVIYLGHIG